MAQHWTDHRIPLTQNGNSSHNWLSGPLCNQGEGWHGSHIPKTFIKEIQGRRCHPRRAWMCLQMLLYLEEDVPVHWDCTKAGHQDLSHQPAFLLTHSCPRPDKGEMRRQGLEKEEERHGSLLALELLVFFLAATFFQAHIIQSNLPCVTTPFFSFEDDLGRECTHWSGLLCPFPGLTHGA